ncbi:archaetidylserine decarboxylase [Povalibacter sp.]|uniref:archaetidylserine decarboxylase n=1 Tax=Povalibacter sp. TaxID=1962978 RepID=UPI002F3E3EC0
MTERIPDSDNVTLGDRLFAGLQYVLPKHLLSRLIYSVMRTESPALRRLIIANFLRGYDVNMTEAVQSDPFAYRSFNDFFTRALRPDARPIAAGDDVVVSPVDGTLSQCGAIRDGQLLQAKGHDYSLLELLANDTAAAATYRNGSFACIYLAPYNYHRIHMPVAGTARSTVYVPGDLFSVNTATARTVPRLFARNERVICDFDTAFGRAAMILVGALFVGSMATVHCGEINPPPRRRKAPVTIDKGIGHPFAKGEELGRFNMGSTVVMLFQQDRIRWEPALAPQRKVVLGATIAQAIARS